MATALLTKTADLESYSVRQTLSAHIDSIREAALAQENVQEWPFIKEFRVLRESDLQSVCYVRSGFPGIKDRDLTVVVTHPEVRSGEVTIDFRLDSSAGPPERNDAVRVRDGHGVLRLRAQGDRETDATFRYEIDPLVRMPRCLQRVMLRRAGTMMLALLGFVSRTQRADRFEFSHLLP